MKTAVVILLVSLSMIAYGADEVSISKTLSKETITDNDSVTIKIIVANDMDETINGTVIDLFPKIAVPSGNFGMDIYSPDPALSWNITLEASGTLEIDYSLEFARIPASYTHRNLTLQPARLEVEGGTYSSERPSLYIIGTPEEGCNYNGRCEKGENYDTCFTDCFSGGRDDYCDGKDDLICDPDCSPGEDPDCGLGTTSTIPAATIGPEEWGYLPYLAGAVVLAIIAVMLLRNRRIRAMKQKKRDEDRMREWVEDQLKDGEEPEALKKALEERGYDAAMVDEIMRRL